MNFNQNLWECMFLSSFINTSSSCTTTHTASWPLNIVVPSIILCCLWTSSVFTGEVMLISNSNWLFYWLCSVLVSAVVLFSIEQLLYNYCFLFGEVNTIGSTYWILYINLFQKEKWKKSNYIQKISLKKSNGCLWGALKLTNIISPMNRS